MATVSNALKAQLSYRILVEAPDEWKQFSIHWMAFNALYGGEPDERERARVMSAIRRFISKQSAKVVLRDVDASMQRIVQLPPGDMRLARWDPLFRAVSQKYKRMYADNRGDPVSRLAAAGAILYQVRCNLIHGSKNPDDKRDRMLVAESLRVLSVLVPALAKGAAAR
jgi:hypothetical protein